MNWFNDQTVEFGGTKRALRGVVSSVRTICEEIYFIDINKGFMKKRVMHNLKGRVQYWSKLEHIYKGQHSLEVNTADRDEHIGTGVKHSSQEA